MTRHDPYVLRYAIATDQWVARCDCGCGLYEAHNRREEAEQAAEEARHDDR